MSGKICSIQGCSNSATARGWCPPHYQMWRRKGDPLGATRKQSPWGVAERYFMETVLTYDGDECLTWPFAKDAAGCGIMSKDGGPKRVPRLVCEAVYGAAPTSEHHAAHSCGRGHEACVAKRHLSWKTPVENAADKIEHGTVVRGERHHCSKLTAEDVLKIREMPGRSSCREIGEIFGVSGNAIDDIRRGKTWAWVEGES